MARSGATAGVTFGFAIGPRNDQRRRSRDDKHGDRARQLAREEQRGRGDGRHCRPYGCALLEHTQDWRRRVLDLCEQLDDAAEHRVRADLANADAQEASNATVPVNTELPGATSW